MCGDLVLLVLLGVVPLRCSDVVNENKLCVFIPFKRLPSFFVEFFHYQYFEKFGSASENLFEASFEFLGPLGDVASCYFELVLKVEVYGLFGRVAKS